MKHSQKKGIALYQHLGRLFYAVAFADGRVHPGEIVKFKEIVTTAWLDLDEVTDRYQTDAAYQIEIVFEWLVENEKDSGECFQKFKDFYNDHPNLFTTELKNRIKSTSRAIAHAFAGTNKAELVLLAKIDLLLK